jgi:hypothetical protein
VISHSASPPTASLLLKCGSIPHGSSFSATISLQSIAPERTTFFGPKKPWDLDSFIYPFVRNLLEPVIGVSVYDALSRSLFALVNGLMTRFCVHPKAARNFLPEAVEQWGKLRRLEGGDIMHAHDVVPKRMDGRHLSSVCVNYCIVKCFSRLIYLYLSPIV